MSPRPHPSHGGAWLAGPCVALALSCFAAEARGDLTPPPRAAITLELTVDNQDAFPTLRFVVTNCGPGEPPSVAVLEHPSPLVCHPAAGPVRVFGVKAADLRELLDLVKRDAGADAAAFMAAKVKTCGAVRDEDLIFDATSGIVFVAARYALDPGKKDGCVMRRVSAATSKQLPAPADAATAASGPTRPAASTGVGSASGGAATPAAPSGCGCMTAPSRASTPIVLIISAVLVGWMRRRRR